MAMSLLRFCFFFFKQKTAYDMRISDWSSDVCSSDLVTARFDLREVENVLQQGQQMAPGAFDAVDILMLLLVEHPGIAEAQELRVADHAVERGPQLVAHIGEEQRLGVVRLTRQIGRASCRERVCQYV